MSRRIFRLTMLATSVVGLGLALADAPTTESAGKPPVDAPLTVTKNASGESRIIFLDQWTEHRGMYDILHVTNLGTTAAVWSGYVKETGKGCICAPPNVCQVGPVCTGANTADTRAYTNLHSCSPKLGIPNQQDVGPLCPAK
jgi:hypothetical protein